MTSVTFGGATKAITAGGSATFDYDGIKLTVFSDGTYTITSTKSVNADTAYDLKYTLGDADGDSSTANIKLIIKDAKPEAFDNVAGHADADYATGNPILLDDFSSKGHWFDSTSAITYGQTLTGNTFTTIDGTSRLATASDTFVRIDATRATGYGVDMDSELQKITGKTGTELFGGKGQYYEKPDLGGYIEKTIDLFTAGELKFNFLFDRGDTGGTSSLKEHAFAVLLNADGTVAWSGILEPNPDAPSDKTSGLCSIAIDKAGHYTLVIGCYDTLNTASRPSLYVDQVVFTPDMPSNVYHGNMIEDTSPMGLVDTMGDGSHLQSITINGHEYTMVAGGLVLTDVFSTGDKLTVSETGNYSYQTHESHFDNVNIDYTLKENHSSDTGSATLYIRSDEFVHEGNVAGHDTIDLSGQSGSHIIEAHGADNLITAGHGNDVIYGGTGHDTIHGGDGNDTIHLGDGGSIVYGDAGHDLIYGGAGHDLIYGGSGNDTIYGGAGNDTNYGGTGDDVMYGGSGYDVFAWNKADYDHGTDKVMDFTLREDRMSFADLFGDARQDNISMQDVMHALTSDRLELTASDQNNLVITINDTLGHAEQTVQVHLEGSGMDAATLQGIMDDDAASKAALLQQMLTNLGG